MGSDENLVQRFVARRGHYIGFLRVLCRDTQLAEELFQELAVVVMEGGPRFDPARDFDSWVRGIARNLYRRALRDRGREVTTGDPELLETVSTAYESAGPGHADREIPTEQFRRCLERLPEHHRSYLRDRYERGLSSRQMAELHAKTVNAVDSILCRIRAALLECLQRRLEVTG